MLNVRDLRQVAWRRRHAHKHYVGHIALTDEAVRLSGRETGTGIVAALSIPPTAIRGVRIGEGPNEQIVGERAIVLELDDDEPIYVRPVGTGVLELETLTRRLAAVAQPPWPVLSTARAATR